MKFLGLKRKDGTYLQINLELLGAYDQNFAYVGQTIPLESGMADVITEAIKQQKYGWSLG